MKVTLRRLLVPLALIAAALLVLSLPAVIGQSPAIPGLDARDRTLLRIWVTSAPGGAQTWLTDALRAWEKQHPGVMTWLRTVSPEALLDKDAVLPDVVLFMPGDITAPQEVFTPLTGSLTAREPLLRAGRWQGQQYGLPLCFGAWVLAIDGAYDPGSAATPAPTTLLGKPAATPAATAAPGYPLEAASRAEYALQAPAGASLFALACTLAPEDRPPLPEGFATQSSAEVYAAFLARKTASAMLTTGQETALASLAASGKAFPYRVMVPGEVITDQVWMAGITSGAPREAAALLAYLTGPDAQALLRRQNLHTVRDDLTLYAADVPALVEQAGRNALSAINAFHAPQEAASAAFRVFQGTMGLSEALTPLI